MVSAAAAQSRAKRPPAPLPRWRSTALGVKPTFPIKSNARNVAEIIEELRHTKTSERAGRAQDKESEDAFEKLRRDGYM